MKSNDDLNNEGDTMTAPFTWAEGSRLVQDLGDERYLARRVIEERKARGWSQQRLSKELDAIDHPLHQSSISKIEAPRHGEKRSISIGEAIAFAKVFDIPLGELLLPPDAVRERKAWSLFIDAAEARNAIRYAQQQYDDLVSRIGNLQPGKDFVVKLRDQREVAMTRTAQQLRDIAADDGDPEDYYDPEDEPPPVVKTIDDVLASLESTKGSTK